MGRRFSRDHPVRVMAAIMPLISDFLAQRRIAVTGVTTKREDAANHIYRKLRDAGYEVYAVNPKLDRFDGDACYPDLASVPVALDGVVVVNRPATTLEIARQCVACGVPRVWMHCMLGIRPRLFKKTAGKITSVSEEAVALCREHGIRVIPGACPMMFVEPVDRGHACIRWLHRRTGSLGA